MKRFLKNILPLLLGFFLVFFFLRGVSWPAVWQAIRQVHYGFVLAFILGILLQYGLKAYRWGVILRSQPAEIPFGTLYHLTALSYFLNLLPGKLGELAKGLLVASRSGFPQGAGLASVVLERLIDLLILVILFLVSFLMFPVGGNPMLARMQNLAWWATPVILMVFVLFFLINRGGLSEPVRRWLERISILFPKRLRPRVYEFLVSFVQNLHVNLTGRDMLRLVVSSFLVWIWAIPVFWLLMQGFEWGRPIGLLETIPYFALIMVGAAIPTPGMAGSIDTASKIGFYQLLGIGVRYDGSVVAYTLLFHTLLLIVTLSTGIVALRRLKIGWTDLKKVKNNEMS